MEFGVYPLDRRLSPESQWGNSIMLSFCRQAAAAYDPRLVMVANGGHPVECFLPGTVRRARGWPIPAGKEDMARYIYPPRLGVKRALRALKKNYFDVVPIHQGEANSMTPPEVYEARFLSWRGSMIRNSLITSRTPIIVGGLFTGYPSYATHKAVIQSIAAQFPNVIFVDSTGLTALPDDTHFTGPSAVTMGQRYYTAFENYEPA
jgi:hypothetical protein